MKILCSGVWCALCGTIGFVSNIKITSNWMLFVSVASMVCFSIIMGRATEDLLKKRKSK